MGIHQTTESGIGYNSLISAIAIVMLAVLCLPLFLVQQQLKNEIDKHESALQATVKENLTQGIIDFQSDLTTPAYVNNAMADIFARYITNPEEFDPFNFGKNCHKTLKEKYGVKPFFLIAADRSFSNIYKNYSKRFTNKASLDNGFDFLMALTTLYNFPEHCRWLISLPHIRKFDFYEVLQNTFIFSNYDWEKIVDKTFKVFGKFANTLPTPNTCNSYYTTIFKQQRVFVYSAPIVSQGRIHGAFIFGVLESDINVSKLLENVLNKNPFQGAKRILTSNLQDSRSSVSSFLPPDLVRVIYTQSRLNSNEKFIVSPKQRIAITIDANLLKSNLNTLIPVFSFSNRCILLFVFFLWIRGILFKNTISISLRRKFMLIVFSVAIFPMLFTSLFSFLIYQQIDKFHLNNAISIVSGKLDQFERIFYEANCRQTIFCLELKKQLTKKLFENNYKPPVSEKFPSGYGLVPKFFILDNSGNIIVKPTKSRPNPIHISLGIKALSNLGVLDKKSSKTKHLIKVVQMTTGLAGDYLDLIDNPRILAAESEIEISPVEINTKNTSVFNLYKDNKPGKSVFAASFLQFAIDLVISALLKNVEKYYSFFDIHKDGIVGTSRISVLFLDQGKLGYFLGNLDKVELVNFAKETIRDRVSGRKIVSTNNGKMLTEWRYYGNSKFVFSAMADIGKEMKLHSLFLFLPAFMGVMSLIILVLMAEAMSSLFNSPIRTLYRGAEQIRKEHDFLTKVSINTKDEIEEMGLIFNNMTSELQMRKNISRFVSEKLLSTLKENDNVENCKGESNHATVLCSDIRGFTSITETCEPEVIVALLNEYFTLMEAAIISNGGVIDKFIGDAIIAVFYPTKENENTMLNACKAAVTMRQSLTLFNSEREKNRLITVENGVGISHGEIISGNVGDSGEYLEFTITGRPIKKANDLEAASKDGKHTKIIIDSCVAKKVSDLYLLDEFELDKHGLVYEIKNEK